jgi:hypothetical protein
MCIYVTNASAEQVLYASQYLLVSQQSVTPHAYDYSSLEKNKY